MTEVSRTFSLARYARRLLRRYSVVVIRQRNDLQSTLLISWDG